MGWGWLLCYWGRVIAKQTIWLVSLTSSLSGPLEGKGADP